MKGRVLLGTSRPWLDWALITLLMPAAVLAVALLGVASLFLRPAPLPTVKKVDDEDRSVAA